MPELIIKTEPLLEGSTLSPTERACTATTAAASTAAASHVQPKTERGLHTPNVAAGPAKQEPSTTVRASHRSKSSLGCDRQAAAVVVSEAAPLVATVTHDPSTAEQASGEAAVLPVATTHIAPDPSISSEVAPAHDSTREAAPRELSVSLAPNCTTAPELTEPVAELPVPRCLEAVSYTHLRAHETVLDLVCRLLLEKKK